ncbi:MAG: ABC transporter permease [Thermoplasmatota archaeon]
MPLVAGIAAGVFLAALFLLPLVGVVLAAFGYGDPVASARAMVARAYYWDRLAFTLEEATLSTLLTMLVGFPLAWALSRSFPGAPLARAILTIPFVLPPLVVAIALESTIPGWSPFALILAAHAFYNIGLVARIVGASWASIDGRLEDAAASLGATGWQRLRRLEVPMLGPSLAASALLVFLFTFTSLGVVLVLGGPQYYTIEAAIWSELQGFDPSRSFPRAAILALVQLVFTIAAMALYAREQERTSVERRVRAPRRDPSRNVKVAASAIAAAGCLAVLWPLATVFAGSFRAGAGYSFENWAGLATFQPAGSVLAQDAAVHTVLFALGTVVVAVPLGICAALFIASRSRRASAWDAAIMAPLGMSSVTLGLGYLVIFPICAGAPQATGALANCVSPGGPVMVVLAHSLIAFPFVARILLSDLRAMDRRLAGAASTLGASALTTLRRIVLPLLLPAIRVAAVFAFAISAGEFGAALILARPDTVTIPVAIYAALASPGSSRYAEAMALSSLLIVLNLLAFLALERFGAHGARSKSHGREPSAQREAFLP